MTLAQTTTTQVSNAGCPAGSRAAAYRPWLIVTGDFVHTGGMDRANLALAEYLAKSGVDTRLVAFRVDASLASAATVQHLRVPLPLRSYTLGLPLLARAGARAARGIAATGGRVVVNGGNCRFGDVNWVHYVHAAYRPDFRGGVPSRLRTAFCRRRELRNERAALGAAGLVIVNSHRTQRDVIGLGVDAARVRVVYYGIDPFAFAPPDKATDRDEVARTRGELGVPAAAAVALFVGALGDRRKGFDTVFDAWRRLSPSTGSSATPVLCVIGSGREAPQWERRVREAGMERSIRLIGFRRDVPRLLRAADLVVSPTRYEAYGLGVHEAICCGVPAIVSRDAGVAERYPDDLAPDMLLPDPNDVDDLVRRLRAWQADPDGWRRRVRPFSDRLRQRSWDDMAAEFVRIVEEANA